MGGVEWFWLFLALVMLQPVIHKRFGEAGRRRLVTRIEHQRGSRVVLLAHRQETMSLLGFPLLRYIDIDDGESVLRAIEMSDPALPVDLVLHIPGGLALPALQVARAIQRRPGKVTVLVPHYAMSGGTLMALAADEIVMSPHAVLGPIDPYVGGYPASGLIRLIEDKPVEHVDDEVLMLADQAQNAVRQVRESVRDMLAGRYQPEAAERLAAMLTEGRWPRDFGITCDLAREMGLAVNDRMPMELMQMMSLYPQPVRNR